MNDAPDVDEYALTENGKHAAQTVAIFFGLDALAVLLVAFFADDMRWALVPPCTIAPLFMITLYDFKDLLKALGALLVVQLASTYILITPPTAQPQVDCVQVEDGQ